MNTKIIAIVIGSALLSGIAWYNLNDETDLGQQSVLANAEKDDHDDDDDDVEAYEIYPGDLVDKLNLNEDVVLLDVRTESEYEEIHLAGAVLLPVQELSQQTLLLAGLGEVAKDKEIYIYCRSGARSKTAYDILTSLGYTKVKSVAGGMIHWEEDKYPFTEVGPYDDSVSKVGVVSAEQGGAKASINESFYDFGEIRQYGGKVEKTFVLKNTGTETLEIGTLTTSCSCTSATIENSQIAPNESAVMTVVFDPDFHEEPLDVFKRTVFIPTNDLSNPELEVTVQVDILEGE